MSILKNAIDSIVIGLEDYQSTDEKRILSSTRNIFAGILLLFKHKLCELSPLDSKESLIKQRIFPEKDTTGAIRWVGKGKKTVDVQNIKERFESLEISVDWNRLDRINEYRNDIEHYFSTQNPQSVQRLISDSFLIIRDFISDHLNEDPRKILGDSAWSVLIETNEVYEKEKTICEEAIESLEYFHDEILAAFKDYSCSECGSGLITPSKQNIEAVETVFTCKSCGKTLPYGDIVKLVVSSHFRQESYASHTDGSDTPLTDCPECDGIYLYNEGICSSCGHEAEHECRRCGSIIMPEELSSAPYCGYCAYMISKDD